MSLKSHNKEKNDTIAIVGLGYVGLTLGIVFAEEGASVIGVDANTAIIDSLEAGIPHFYEPGLEQKLSEHSKKISFVSSIQDAKEANAYVISVGSNVDTNGKPDYSHVEQASKDIGSVLKKGDIVILRSTVTMGTTRTRVVPILEELSGLTVGSDFHVAFAPERTIEGKALEELRSLPQIVAGYTRACRDEAARLFMLFTKNLVLVDTLEEAELSKLISNAYRDLTFSFANSVALIASEHNVNVNTVIAAANEGYTRNRIPLPSPGVGGYCLTKDPLLLAHGTTTYAAAGDLLRQGRTVNQLMTEHVAQLAQDYVKQTNGVNDPHVVIVGLAFKGNPATSDVRFSPSEMVIKGLRARGFSNISGYDPHVAPEVFEGWGIGRIEEPEAIAASGDIVVLMHKSDEYADHNTLLFKGKNLSSLKFVLDPWGMYNQERESILEKGIAYGNLGFRSFEK